MRKATFLAALFALLNFTLTFAAEAHAHPGHEAARSILGEECEGDDGECDGECDGEECDDDTEGAEEG